MSTTVDVSLTVNGERVSRRIEARRHGCQHLGETLVIDAEVGDDVQRSCSERKEAEGIRELRGQGFMR